MSAVVRLFICRLLTLVKESSQRARLEEEMLSAKSDSVVEVALLRVECERKQEIMQAKLKEVHKRDLEKGKKIIGVLYFLIEVKPVFYLSISSFYFKTFYFFKYQRFMNYNNFLVDFFQCKFSRILKDMAIYFFFGLSIRTVRRIYCHIPLS